MVHPVSATPCCDCNSVLYAVHRHILWLPVVLQLFLEILFQLIMPNRITFAAVIFTEFTFFRSSEFGVVAYNVHVKWIDIFCSF